MTRAKDEPVLTPAGELLMIAVDAHVAHLEQHDCEECHSGMATLIKALTEWIGKPADEEKTEKLTKKSAMEIFGEKPP